MTENLELAKKLRIAAWIVSGAVLILVGLMRRVKLDVGIDFSFLPPIHAGFNVCVAISLVMALVYIKKKNVVVHQRWIFTAMTFSFLFLLSYVAYHFTTSETLYGDYNKDGVVSAIEKARAGGLRIAYLILLLTHIVSAAISLPFILFTFIRGFTGQVAGHRRMARYVWPVWFFVAVSGPVCYWMLRPFYL